MHDGMRDEQRRSAVRERPEAFLRELEAQVRTLRELVAPTCRGLDAAALAHEAEIAATAIETAIDEALRRITPRGSP